MALNIDKLYAKYKGQSVLVPGNPEANRGQCVQWVDTALHDSQYGFNLPYHYGNAIDWWFAPGNLLTNFKKIVGGSPKKGDIVVFGTGVGSVYGHIDVCGADGTGAGFLGYDSNWDGNKTVHSVQHTYKDVIGYFRRKGVDMTRHELKHIISRQIFLCWGRDATDKETMAYADQVESGKRTLENLLLGILNDPQATANIAKLSGE